MFINIALILGVILSTATHRIVSKTYTLRIRNGAFTFSVLNTVGAILIYLIFGGISFDFPPELYLYSLLFAVFFFAAALCGLLAIAKGSLALTCLILSFSPLIPTVYGILFLGEPTSVTLFIGLVSLAISLVLINIEKKGETKKITLAWIIFVLLGLLGDGAKSTMLKIQQLDFSGLYKNEFLVISFAIVALVCLIIALIKEKEHISFNLRVGGRHGLLCGLLTGIINLFVSILSSPARNMPASVMFPLISAGGIISSLAVATFIFNEKLSKPQLCGLFLGMVSIVFLSI